MATDRLDEMEEMRRKDLTGGGGVQLADRTPPPTARAAVKTRRAEADKVALYSGGVQGGGYSFETTRGVGAGGRGGPIAEHAAVVSHRLTVACVV